VRRLLVALFILFLTFEASAQVIYSIQHEGLKKTKESYLSQFFSFDRGDQLDSTKLDETKQRLVNLEMFGNVDYAVYTEKDQTIVIFTYQELFTLLPIFSFGGIEENFWFQIGASEVNLGGSGNKLYTYYQYYDRSSFATHLRLDRIRKSNWGVNLNLIKWSTLEPLFFNNGQAEYEYDNYTVGFDVIRHFGFRDRLEVGGAFFTEDYRRSSSGFIEGAPDQVNTKKLLGKVININDRINYHFYYLDGWHNQLNLETVQSLDGDPPFYIAFNDIKYFERVGGYGNFASRLRLGLSTNEESPFAPFVLDSYLNIRGVGNRVDRGTGAIILNLEYRQTLLEQGNVAVQGVGFSDLGTWRNPGGNFSDFSSVSNQVLFAGAGLRLIHKRIFNAILRFDYGFNLREPEVNGIVIGIGQYF